MSAAPGYAEALQAVLQAPTAPAKAALLAALRAPAPGECWQLGELPPRPAREPAYRDLPRRHAGAAPSAMARRATASCTPSIISSSAPSTWR